MLGMSQASHEAMLTIFAVSGPLLAVIMVIGVIVAIFLAATQLNEPTLSFVPKFIGIAIALAVMGPWLLRQLEQFTVMILTGLPRMVS
ncbi:MAG TPA: flagellar biosynthetic protein FliQ [Stellaceae bacterium]|nr:flagellar biosynthetic protein FliQ [Stellaceae bacterium]